MEFSANNTIVKLCLQGMAMEENNKPEEAAKIFLQAWNEATNDFEKFLAAYYVARHQKNTADKINWIETALQLALQLNNDAVKPALPLLYSSLASYYAELHDEENAKKNQQLANQSSAKPTDAGPYYHGTKADLQVGDFLTAGNNSNYQSELVMNHVYFTALLNGAGLAAALAKGEGHERVYVVEPTGEFENDPNPSLWRKYAA